MNHLMLDLETLGNEPGDVIVSIGAVQFDLQTGITGEEFYREINITQSLNEGFKVKGSTIAWWMNQEQDAREKIVSAEDRGIHPKQALFELRTFIDSLEPSQLQIWGNSNRFDLGILAAYYSKFYPGKDLPWHFAQERDVRTLVSFAPQVKAMTIFKGTRHNPIDDCKHQIKYLRNTWYEAMGLKYVLGFNPYQDVLNQQKP